LLNNFGKNIVAKTPVDDTSSNPRFIIDGCLKLKTSPTIFDRLFSTIFINY